MNRNRKGTKERRPTIQPWTYEQARGVLPYLRSIVASLREHRLEALSHHLRARRLQDKPGRPDRSEIIAIESARRAAREADARFHDALEELHTLDVYCLDPVRGEALVPFVHDNQLAWYIFDLFDDEPFRFWRYHSDPLDTRRPLAETQEGASDTPLVV
jgi:Uncharacterized conserved protein (DUF2203)